MCARGIRVSEWFFRHWVAIAIALARLGRHQQASLAESPMLIDFLAVVGWLRWEMSMSARVSPTRGGEARWIFCSEGLLPSVARLARIVWPMAVRAAQFAGNGDAGSRPSKMPPACLASYAFTFAAWSAAERRWARESTISSGV